MIMERTSRLQAARAKQASYAAELDAQIRMKQSHAHGVGHGRRGAPSFNVPGRSTAALPVSATAPFGTDTNVHGQVHPDRRYAKLQENDQLYKSEVFGYNPEQFKHQMQAHVRRNSMAPPEQAAFAAQRSKQQAYMADLQRQIELKNQRKQREKEEREAWERREEKEMMEYNPWGRGGAGAPLRDASGHVITDLRGGATQAVANSPLRHQSQQVQVQVKQQRQQMAGRFTSPRPAPQQQQQPAGGGGEEGANFTRFRFSALSPERQAEIRAKQQAREELQADLQRQIDDKKRRKQMEKDRENEWERKEEARLERERQELAKASSPSKPGQGFSAGEQQQGGAGGGKVAMPVSPITSPQRAQVARQLQFSQGPAPRMSAPPSRARRRSGAQQQQQQQYQPQPRAQQGGGGGHFNSGAGINLNALAGGGMQGYTSQGQGGGVHASLAAQLLLANAAALSAGPGPATKSGPSVVEQQLLQANEEIRRQLQEQQSVMKQLAAQVSTAWRQRDTALLMHKALTGGTQLTAAPGSPGRAGAASASRPGTHLTSPRGSPLRTHRRSPARSEIMGRRAAAAATSTLHEWKATAALEAASAAHPSPIAGSLDSGAGFNGTLKTKSEFIFSDGAVVKPRKHRRSHSIGGSGTGSGEEMRAAQRALGLVGSAAEEELGAGYGARSSVSAHGQHRAKGSYVSNMGRAVFKDNVPRREQAQNYRQENVLKSFVGDGADGRTSQASSGRGGRGLRGQGLDDSIVKSGGDELDNLLNNFVGKKHEWA